MPRARSLVAAVPQRVWTAVAGLVLLASLGVTLVLAAGLSTWKGAVGNSPNEGSAQPPRSVVTPPGNAVIVVPTPHARRPVPAAPPHPAAAAPARVTIAGPAAPVAAPVTAPVTAPVILPPAQAPVPSTPVTATPRVTHGSGAVGTGKARHGHQGKPAHQAMPAKAGEHSNRGKHLGWLKNDTGKRG